MAKVDSRRSRLRPGRRSRRPADDLVDALRRIHAHPELCFEETVRRRAVAETLGAGGFAVETGVYDLPTAFEATAGSGPLSIVDLRRVRRPARHRPRLRPQRHRRRRRRRRPGPGRRWPTTSA